MKRKNRLLIILVMLLLSLYCSEQVSVPVPIEREVELYGRKLIKHQVDTDFPCIVNIMFQVLNMQNKGISGLSTSHFELTEDDEHVSPTEAGMYILNRQSADYVLRSVIMIDNSASIGSNLQHLKDAALEYIDQLTEYQQVAIYQFSDMPILLQYFTNDLELLRSAIDKIEQGYPSTNLYGAVIEGLTLWDDVYEVDEIQQGIMLLLTDGSDTQGSSTLTRLIEERGDKMIYALGIGDEIDSTKLKKIGNAGFYHADDYPQLAEKFIEIQTDVINYANSFYWLVYFSPKRGNKKHHLKLHLLDNPYIEEEDSFVDGTFNSAGFYSVNPGIFIESTMADPEGIDSLLISPGDTRILNVDSYYARAKPEYSWSSHDESVVTVDANFLDSSVAMLSAIGASGRETKISVHDVQNSLTKTIDVYIE
ncbi:VWA domain-containing protein [candidate division KSB1 bacterium]|nr:VWA domain-containing protein [candidate division KSB1 bacterium]